MIKKTDLSQFQIWTILGGAAVMLSLAMGMRQSFGLLQPHMIRDIGITAADFSLAIALQNIVWGATQPVIGIWADKYGTRPVALVGVLIYILGLVFLRLADATWMVTLGIGFCGHCLVMHSLQHCNEHHGSHRQRNQARGCHGSCRGHWILGLDHCFTPDPIAHYKL
jgi:sugar phosphate permease